MIILSSLCTLCLKAPKNQMDLQKHSMSTRIYCNFTKLNVSPGKKIKAKRTVLSLNNSEALPKNDFYYLKRKKQNRINRFCKTALYLQNTLTV